MFMSFTLFSSKMAPTLYLDILVCISKQESIIPLLVSLDSEPYCLHLLINFIFNSLAGKEVSFENSNDHFGINIGSVVLGCQATVTAFVNCFMIF